MTLTTICHVHGHVQVLTKVTFIFTIYGKKLMPFLVQPSTNIVQFRHRYDFTYVLHVAIRRQNCKQSFS